MTTPSPNAVREQLLAKLREIGVTLNCVDRTWEELADDFDAIRARRTQK